ncbi:type II toxin-antitoxin system VapB family antitoxin [Brevundimonas sp. GCM10030266]|uniref:type II toxin-antitoxin system VapB family antitoxin n=1 Tax=Brevundimonas sp. GCM10030266 TaxID=3273386 RepID=UPI00362393D1
MLNIKNPETHRLARELAARRGETLTTAVTVALREQLAREPAEPHKATAEEVMALIREMRAHLEPLGPDEDPTAFLYDPETGLPA